ncbi:MAG TPA: hypothetical protein VGL53_30725 [Bryobacteraceae bacterium]
MAQTKFSPHHPDVDCWQFHASDADRHGITVRPSDRLSQAGGDFLAGGGCPGLLLFWPAFFHGKRSEQAALQPYALSVPAVKRIEWSTRYYAASTAARQ